MLATLGATAALTVLSIVGAFLSVDGARRLFNSDPMVLFWLALTGLLLVGLVYFKKLLRSPASLAVHLGPVLVLIGAMYGSVRGHDVAARLGLHHRVPTGYMQIFEGQASSAVVDDQGRQVATLPFEIRLEDFWIEYYQESGPWRLGVDAPPPPGSRRRRMAEIRWTEGEDVEIPYVGASLEVLRYLPRARPDYDEDAVPTLEVIESDGRRSVVPAKVGEEFDLAHPEGTLKVVKVFGHLLVRDGQVVDVPDSDSNPAVKVELQAADGATSHRYAFASGALAGHGQGSDGLQLTYALPGESGAVADPDSELPAMEVLVRSDEGDELRGWLIARDARRPAALSLSPLVGSAPVRPGAAHHQGGVFLLLVGRDGDVRDYKSRLTVLGAGGQELAQQEIEVNSPLHYGGYHFYQHSYDNRAGRFTVLSVRSDAGLDLVWLGFAMLCFGVFWLFYGRPLVAWARSRRANDGN